MSEGHQNHVTVGLYELLIHSQCITCSRFESAHSQFGEADRNTGMEAKQRTAVDGPAAKHILTTFSLSIQCV